MNKEPRKAIDELHSEALQCRACPLWRHATQLVFGEGTERAAIMLVGEQPGNEEDLQGRPFRGAAGNLLDKALADAGIDRAAVYVTNAVKHFKWEPRGTRRVHKSPAQKEIDACNRWLQAEITSIEPRLVICLGAIAGRALLGRIIRIGLLRGTLHESVLFPGLQVAVTYHPAFVLRQRDPDLFLTVYSELVGDLEASIRMMKDDRDGDGAAPGEAAGTQRGGVTGVTRSQPSVQGRR